MNSPSFDQILLQRTSRRRVLKGLGMAALAGALPLPMRALAQELQADTALSSLTFTEVTKGLDAQHHVAQGYAVQTLLRWGDAVLPDAPAFDPHAQTPQAQSKQAGYNHDFIAYFPLGKNPQNSHEGLLCINHEFTSGELMFDGYSNAKTVADELTDAQHRTEMAAHGVSVVEVRRSEGGQWQIIKDRYNRRITANTPITLSGPAAGHARLRTTQDATGRHVLGTFGNCAGGVTPWGTYLTCEENVDVYFMLDQYDGPERANHQMMTIGSRYYHRWDKIEDRFSVAKEPHEPNRHFWVVEIDPFDPASRPVKRTALGRMKHEGASCVLNHDGRVCVYMGDDQAFQCIYRFVSKHAYDPLHRAHNLRLLDEGTLSVARFDADGTLQWLPLVQGEGPLTHENGFDSQADVVIEARRAAALLGATPMDRPEDVEVNPVNGRIYACMTKNPLRMTADAVNRRAPNPMGYVVEMLPPLTGEKVDHAATRYRWEMLLEGGDPQAGAYRQGRYGDNLKDMPVETEDAAQDIPQHLPPQVSEHGYLACPDNLAFDPLGRIWITTDGQPDAINAADAIYACEADGPYRGITRQFFRGPDGCEITGPCFTPDGKTLFVSVQHPAGGSTFANPSTRWPDFDPAMPARSAVIAITKEDGGVIGS